MFTFLGWFLLSVKNNKSSIKLACTGFVVEKFKNIPSAITLAVAGFEGDQEYIIHLLPTVA